MNFFSSKQISALIIAVILFCLTSGNIFSQKQSFPPIKKFPKNIIVFIGDGMGYNAVLAGNYYQNGTAGSQVYESFPIKCGMSNYCGKIASGITFTQSYNSAKAWSDFNYFNSGFTDSAPAATSMSTGVKSYEGAIGVDLNNNNLVHITANAKALRKATGVVSTVEFSHATPAGYVSHNISRNNYSAIAQEMLNSDVDLIIGAGHPNYDDNGNIKTTPNYTFVGGQTMWDNVKAGYKGWTLIEKKADFEKLMTGATPNRVVGVLPVATTSQQARSGNGNAAPYAVPLNSTVPSLETLTKASINILNKNQNGFFVMIEGGAIDWAAHANQSGRLIEEQIDFNNAVQAAVNWVETNSSWDETLIIVTADHETGYLTGPNSNDNNPSTNPVINNGKNNVPGMKWNSGNHTNQIIPFFAKGAGSEIFNRFADEVDLVRGKYLDNTELGIACKMLFPMPEHTFKTLKNIIFLISDGCGLSHILTTNYYQKGADKTQVYQSFPVSCFMSTYAGKYDPVKPYSNIYDSESCWNDFNYVNSGFTDSAPAATSMGSGIKSFDGALGVDLWGKPIQSIAEKFKEIGKSAGIITSVEFSHATPAGFVVHNPDRNQYSSIAQEMINSDMDVIMGACNPWYDDNSQLKGTPNYTYVGGQTYWDNLKSGYKGWTLIEKKSDFIALAQGSTPTRLIGVPQVATTLQQARGGDGKAAPYVVPLNQNVPTLVDMTKAAINVLDNNNKGFFIMIEGGAIDWAAHANQTGRTIEEEIDFNNTVDYVVNWVETNSNWDETLVIVTGDHETGYLTGPVANNHNPFTNPIINNGKNNVPGVKWNSGNHTNQLIPFFAKGAGSEIFNLYADQYDKVFGKYINNTEIGQAMYHLTEIMYPLTISLPDKSTCQGNGFRLSNIYNHLGKEYNMTVLGGSKKYQIFWDPAPILTLNPYDPSDAIFMKPYYSQDIKLDVIDKMTGEIKSKTSHITVFDLPYFSLPLMYKHNKNTELDLNSLITDKNPDNQFVWLDKNYNVIDPNTVPALGINKYYVYAVDENNCQSYLKRIIVYVMPAKEGADDFTISNEGSIIVNTYPNPVVNSLNINAEFDGEVIAYVKLIDMSGAQLMSFSRNVTNTLNETLDMSKLSNGVYFLTIEANGDKLVEKIIK